jgi:hypothetical protein
MCKGGSLQYTLQLNQTTQTPKLELYKCLYNVTKLTRASKYTNQVQDIQKRYSNHTLGPNMPQVALTPPGLPSLASNHKSTQGSNM